MTQFLDMYRGRRVLVTGHTGFKGSWLVLWLEELGAKVTGLALDPDTKPSHWDLLGLRIDDRRGDVRDASLLSRLVAEVQPEIVFHLAAQPLVRRSYQQPLETWSTNVLGTANLLEACRTQPSVRAVVVVTTDKCYENREWLWAYRESDALGGHDPYSASKAAAELVAASYRSAFCAGPSSPAIATARAGNVVGGGDWSEDRLIPDLVRALDAGVPLEVRSPGATRPWQHVLEPLSGYLLLGQRLFEGRREFAEAWNFGPDAEGSCTVAQLLDELRGTWPAAQWRQAPTPQLHEAHRLQLDSSRARELLGWRPAWSLAQCLAATGEWYRTQSEGRPLASRAQLALYAADAQRAGISWSGA